MKGYDSRSAVERGIDEVCTWVISGAALYFLAHALVWALRGFPVLH